MTLCTQLSQISTPSLKSLSIFLVSERTRGPSTGAPSQARSRSVRMTVSV